MIKYVLAENSITAENKTFYAVVSSIQTKNLEDIIDHMIDEGSGLTRPQAMAYFEKLSQSVMFFASQGYSIATPLFRIRPTICGSFSDKEDKYDPVRHQIKIRGSEGQRLRDMSMQIKKIVKVDESLQLPILNTFTDALSDTINSKITSKGIAVLKGKLLGFDKNDTRLGIFFIPENTPENKIRVIGYSGIQPSNIHFSIPELPSGNYQLTLQTLTRNGKSIMSGSLATSLQVL